MCSPGAEFQCATAASYYCTCACGGKNHGKLRHLRAVRNADTQPWTTHKARTILAAERAKMRKLS